MRWLSFRLLNKSPEKEGRRFAIRQSQAVESVPFSGVTPELESPEPILGTVTYRGKAVRVFDLGVALGLGACDLPHRVRVLIARQSRTAAPVGIAVQPELEEVASLDSPGLAMVDLRKLAKLGRRG